VERSEPRPPLRAVGGVDRVQRRAAVPAEPLLVAVLGLPGPEPILALDDAEGAGHDRRARRRRRPAPPLTARAMAVARRHQRLGDLEPDRAASAAAGERGTHAAAPS